MVRLNAVSACKIATRREELRRRGREIGGQLQRHSTEHARLESWDMEQGPALAACSNGSTT